MNHKTRFNRKKCMYKEKRDRWHQLKNLDHGKKKMHKLDTEGNTRGNLYKPSVVAERAGAERRFFSMTPKEHECNRAPVLVASSQRFSASLNAW